MTDAIDTARIIEYVRSNVGRELSADILHEATGVPHNEASYWLRDRSRNKRSMDLVNRPFDGKVHRFGHGLYVYFPGPVPIDWNDRIKDWGSDHPRRRRRVAATPKGNARQTGIQSSMMFELVRYNADTGNMILADEDGTVWTGRLVRVEA